jgi:hypothetical protein
MRTLLNYVLPLTALVALGSHARAAATMAKNADPESIWCQIRNNDNVAIKLPAIPISRLQLFAMPEARAEVGGDYVAAACSRRVNLKIPAGYSLSRVWGRVTATHPKDVLGRTDVAVLLREEGVVETARVMTLGTDTLERKLDVVGTLLPQGSCFPAMQRTLLFNVDTYVERLAGEATAHSGLIYGTLFFTLKPCKEH